MSRDPDLDEMLALGVPLIRPVFSLADSDANDGINQSAQSAHNAQHAQSAPLRRPASSVTFQLPSHAASHSSLPTLDSLSSSSASAPTAQTANERYAVYADMATPPIATRPVSLLPPAIASLAHSSSSLSSSSKPVMLGGSGSGGRRKAAFAFDSGSSAPLSELQATMRTSLELLSLERSDEGESFFRGVQDKVGTGLFFDSIG
jgi:hypothetical protein